MPFDPRYYRYRRPRSMAGPILLVAVGVMFLLMNMHIVSWSRVGWFFATWWPLLLILFGVIRIAEYAIARSHGGAAPRLGGGAVFLLILLIVIGFSASSARHVNWQGFGDNVDVNPGWDGMFGEKYDFNQELSQPLPTDGRIQIESDRGSVIVHVAENGDTPVKVVVHRHISADSQDSANKFNDQQKPTMSVDGNILRIDSGERVAHVQVGFVMGPRIVTELGKLDGDLTMDSGDLRASSIAGPFEVRTKAKDIRLEDVSGPITVENSHGEIDVHPKAPFGDVSLSNHQGAIHIVLPEAAGFTVEARSSHGELESDFPLNVTRNGDDRVAEGNVGKGGKKLQLTTDHGTIEIRKG